MSDTSDIEFDSALVEEFYNAFHDPKSGRFTFRKGGKKGKIHVPMSDAARRSNAILRSTAAARKSKEYKQAKKNANGSWADRETGQGGLRGIKGASSKKADAARAGNAKTGAGTKAHNAKVDATFKSKSAAYKLKSKNEINSMFKKSTDAWKAKAASKSKNTENPRTPASVMSLTEKYGSRRAGAPAPAAKTKKAKVDPKNSVTSYEKINGKMVKRTFSGG